VPELVAVAVEGTAPPVVPQGPVVGEWQPSWSGADHAAAVSAVREAIARGDVYQANVVGHRSAPHRSAPRDVAHAVAGIGAKYAGVLTGEGWAVGCASPEQLVRIEGRRITTEPIKGTRRVAPGSREELRASGKDRADEQDDRGAPPLARRLAVEAVRGQKICECCRGIWSISATPLQPVDLAKRSVEMSGWCAYGWVKSVHNHPNWPCAISGSRSTVM
jgi:para-aminobenzoate synthetase component 1